MKSSKILSLLLLGLSSSVFAQDLEQAKKAIDAEQYDKAKKILKALVKTNPDNGKNFFYLGDVYLRESETDSAMIFFNKGIASKDRGTLNLIGLGQIDLDNKKVAAAQDNFNKATANIKKKDVDELLLIARAYVNSENPDYKKGVEAAKKVLLIDDKNAQAYYVLGNAYFGDKNTNEAFSAYRNAYDLDNSLLAAKMKLAAITKNAKAFGEAVSSFEEIVKINPSYGPVYRELAETYSFWAQSEPAKYNEYIAKALGYYEKYMSLTDYSVDSRMRHADFLILAKDYKALEKEANEMKKLNNVNPRIYRYLGYAAYENGNFAESSKALTEFFSKVEPKRIIARDYLYLGLTKMAEAKKADGTYDDKIFSEGVAEMHKAVDKDPVIANELNPLGQKMFKEKLYKNAAKLFEVAIKNPKSKNYLYDNFYLGYALYFDYDEKTSPKDQLTKADAAFSKVIEVSPTTQDAYFYKARVNDAMDTPESKKVALASYEEYVKIVNTKGDAEKAKPATKKNLIEAYTFVGAHYANSSEKAKAIENLEKLIALDPANAYAAKTLKALKA
ncbi:tetratricopeptide repeat protein [Flavobacterium sp. SM15]|uniref:tetratricopeptide repeat protein n=1 Tax=Flavobacterium sp. SM15 TaxID=2908005 RepID=UPI001ED9F077|nr:tetratricopeptide repeat protein [Flavobacterium sp. SM15]MCG2609891.1 tetratricopeptide repeat protein [Flavobacterium sp. SM15]